MDGDVIGNFLAITNSTDEEKAINYLSVTDFNLGEAVQLYFASESTGGGGGGSNNVAEVPDTTPPVREDSIDIATRNAANNNNEATRLFDDDDIGGGFGMDALRDEVFHHGGGGGRGRGGLANFANYLQDRFGGDPTGHYGGGRGRGGGRGPSREVYSINPRATFSAQFIDRHFGALPIFRLPDVGCDRRYTRTGGRPQANDGFTLHNPILDAFDNCCHIAVEKKKFVFLVILEGGNTFPSMAFSRDILNDHKVGAAFISSNLMPFYQVRLQNAALMVETSHGASHDELLGAAHREGGSAASDSVRRMIYLQGLVSRYNLTPNEADYAGNRALSQSAYPIAVIINPSTKAIVHRISLPTIIVRKNDSDFAYDVSAFMSQVLPISDTASSTMVKLDTDEFFLPDEGGATAYGGQADASGAETPDVIEVDSPTRREASVAEEEDVVEVAEQPAVVVASPPSTTLISVEGSVAVGQDPALLTAKEGSAVMKLRLRMPSGMHHVVCLDSIPLRDFLLFISWNSAPSSVLNSGAAAPSTTFDDTAQSSGSLVGTPSTSSLITSPSTLGPASLSLQAVIPQTVIQYAQETLQCLGGFPPRPLAVPEDTFDASSTHTLKDWKGIRSGDMLTVGSK